MIKLIPNQGSVPRKDTVSRSAHPSVAQLIVTEKPSIGQTTQSEFLPLSLLVNKGMSLVEHIYLEDGKSQEKQSHPTSWASGHLCLV